MKITFFIERGSNKRWLGDIQALVLLKEGLDQLGHTAIIDSGVSHLEESDFIFLSNIVFDLNSHYNVLKLLGKRYGLIPFHENFARYWGPCMAFFGTLLNAFQSDKSCETLDFLREAPDHILFFAPAPKKAPLINYNVIKQAQVCIANSPTERETILRDCPGAKTEVIFWGPGLFTDQTPAPDDSFRKLSGLSKGEYILQVGRFSPQKNQLASILGTQHLHMPLVFIANYLFYPEYTELCLKAIVKHRQAPTLIFSCALPEMSEGSLRVIRLKEGEMTPHLLQSAYHNAGLYLHPAFTELPGFVNLEAAYLGTPVVTSTWTTLKDYFTDGQSGAYTLDDRISYLTKPYDINAIEREVTRNFGRRFPIGSHPLFKRKATDMAQELLEIVLKPSTDGFL